jgi:acylphosphatase
MPARFDDTGSIERVRSRILVCGAMQGVGFRPFVHRQATALGLAGWVINSSQGVVVEAEGDPERIAALVRKIRENPPANSAVDIVETSAIALRWGRGPFVLEPGGQCVNVDTNLGELGQHLLAVATVRRQNCAEFAVVGRKPHRFARVG